MLVAAVKDSAGDAVDTKSQGPCHCPDEESLLWSVFSGQVTDLHSVACILWLILLCPIQAI